MLLKDVLLNLNRDQNPITVEENKDGETLFKIDEELYQALWWLDYSIIYEGGIYFLTHTIQRKQVVQLKPVKIPSKDGVFVELNLKMPEKYENE